MYAEGVMRRLPAVVLINARHIRISPVTSGSLTIGLMC